MKPFSLRAPGNVVLVPGVPAVLGNAETLGNARPLTSETNANTFPPEQKC